MWLENAAFLLSPLSVGVPITGVSRLVFSDLFFCCSFKLKLKMVMMMRRRTMNTKLGSRTQKKLLAVWGGRNGRCDLLLFSENLHGGREDWVTLYRICLKLWRRHTWCHWKHLPWQQSCDLDWDTFQEGRIYEKSAHWSLWAVFRAGLLPGAPRFTLLVHLVIEGSVGTRSARTCTDRHSWCSCVLLWPAAACAADLLSPECPRPLSQAVTQKLHWASPHTSPSLHPHTVLLVGVHSSTRTWAPTKKCRFNHPMQANKQI